MNLVKDTSRPVVMLKNWNNFRALLDTGAYFPIWIADENILKDLGGSCIRKEVPFGGFGGEAKGNFDDKNHKLNINIPDDESYIRNLTIKDSNDRWYVLCNSDYDEIKDTNAEFCTFRRARP